ncbi:MAG: hypothetical protein ACPGU7_11985 [Gammaproteobacteria bacterium]
MKYILVFALALLAVGSANAEGVAFRWAAEGPSEADARFQAYYEAAKRELEHHLGGQAVLRQRAGSRLKREFERNFDETKRMFFPGVARERCATQTNNRVQCSIRGRIDRTAMRQYARTVVQDTEQTHANALVFGFSSQIDDGPAENLLVGKLRGQIANYGHTLLTERGTLNAVGKKGLDLLLGLREATFSPVQYDAGDERGEGHVRIRFTVTDGRSSIELGSESREITAAVIASSETQAASRLREKLATQAAEFIARKINDTTIAHQQGAVAKKAAITRKASGGKFYIVRLLGIQQRDRKTIRAVRQTLTNLGASKAPRTDPTRSDASQVTVVFESDRDLVHDDVLDALYETFGDNDRFSARYVDGREYELSF